jgi:hypothetical protein
MDYRELSSKIRSKYPGAYDDLDDNALAQKIVAKYPQYADTTFDSVAPKPQAELSIAESAVSAITPEVQGPPPKEGFLSRLARGTRQMFFPSSIGEVKSLANPNMGQFGVSKILEEEGKRVGAAVRGSLEGAPGPVKFVGDVLSDQLTPSASQQNLGAEGIGMAARMIGPALKQAAVDPARRALGFQKSQLVSQKSPFETVRKVAQANRSAEAMLKEGAISPTGNVDDSIKNATKILSDNSRKLSDVIESVDKAGKKISASSMDSQLIDELKPKFDDDFNVSDKILSDIKAFGKDGLSLRDVDELKARWGKIGFQDKTVGSTAADMHRKAWGAADKIIKRHIETVAPDSVGVYKTAKAGQENAINALRGLGNKQAADLGNNVFSLPTKVLAAGQLATGNIPGAVATAGVMEVLKRRGLAPVARGLYGAGKALEEGAKPGFLAALSAAARKSLESEKAKSKPSGSSKNFLAEAVRASKPGFEKKLRGAASTMERSSSASPLPVSKPLSPENTAYAQGLTKFLDGDVDGAKRDWQRVLKINPKNLDARRGLERLAKKEGKDIDTYRPKSR